MFTIESVKQELEDYKNAPMTGRNANDYAALLIIHDHMCAKSTQEAEIDIAPIACMPSTMFTAVSSKSQPMEFDHETAEQWVRSMKNEDKTHPVGGKWSPDMLKPLAEKYGLPTEGKKFWELYAMTNAMYSNFSEVSRKFGITSPEYYVCMAKAWMEDKDAVENNTALFYKYIVKKD